MSTNLSQALEQTRTDLANVHKVALWSLGAGHELVARLEDRIVEVTTNLHHLHVDAQVQALIED